MSELEVVAWEDDAVAMDSVQYDVALLGPSADVETEHAVCARLVPGLCERADISALRQLATTLTEIPESYLADIIFTTLASTDPDGAAALDDMLRLPYTPATMTSVLRRRHLCDVSRLVEHVTERLQTAEADLAETLMDWLAVLLDSQYANVVMADAGEVHQLLGRVAAWRDGQEAAAQEAALLLRTLDLMKAQRRDPPSPPAADYCVETLEL